MNATEALEKIRGDLGRSFASNDGLLREWAASRLVLAEALRRSAIDLRRAGFPAWATDAEQALIRAAGGVP